MGKRQNNKAKSAEDKYFKKLWNENKGIKGAGRLMLKGFLQAVFFYFVTYLMITYVGRFTLTELIGYVFMIILAMGIFKILVGFIKLIVELFKIATK